MILGIWDGHDAGAAIVDNNEVKVAVNEERFTRRKLDVGFPKESIIQSLKYLGIRPSDIEYIAISTSDFAKTMSRLLPFLKDRYYLIRRRKVYSRFVEFQKLWKYRLTRYGPSFITRSLTDLIIRHQLNSLGFRDYKLFIVDHHAAHAATAAFSSNFSKASVVTIDGVGDGLSGTVNIFEDGELRRVESLPPEGSLGIFFEHVTNLLGMRELEDEGKVMALSDFAYPIPDSKNPMLSFFDIKGTKIKGKYSWTQLYHKLKKILWSTPREQFSWMAQRTLEKILLQFFENVVKATGFDKVAWAGGVASNIKANQKIRLLKNVKDWFVFPHMGDGGLALGAAMMLNYELNGITKYKFNDVYFGLDYDNEEIENELRKSRMDFEYDKNIESVASDLILDNEIVFWFQGRMEYGPRALGNRSILAHPGNEKVKDTLNLKIKKRVWYQPFCPSILDIDAKKVFYDYDKTSRFMTMGYTVRKDFSDKLKSVVHVDMSSRPQMVVGDENIKYTRLLKKIRRRYGIGIVLNTSLNIHGAPIVCSPRDAINTMKKTKNRYMILGNYLVTL